MIISTVVIAQNTGSKATSGTKKKYAYAILYYDDEWDRVGGNPKRHSVNCDYIKDDLKNKIKSVKYTDDALNLLGEDGWELISVVTEKLNLGTEYIHYLKKEIN